FPGSDNPVAEGISKTTFSIIPLIVSADGGMNRSDPHPVQMQATWDTGRPGGTMPIMNERDRREVQAQLATLTGPVKLVNFTQELACQYCRETERLLKEVKELSDKISVEVYNFQLDKEKVAQYRVDKIPATVVEGSKDYGIRFYGIPLGYEFVPFLDAIKDISRGSTDLKPATRTALSEIQDPVHLQVFTTPT
ncbi:MAG TPA: thioredoxin family protein, partial [Candidatus Acidoferrum sp.]|nr:thioredoxin family protein [Candidatus Acidoferrum sp.]